MREEINCLQNNVLADLELVFQFLYQGDLAVSNSNLCCLFCLLNIEIELFLTVK